MGWEILVARNRAEFAKHLAIAVNRRGPIVDVESHRDEVICVRYQRGQNEQPSRASWTPVNHGEVPKQAKLSSQQINALARQIWPQFRASRGRSLVIIQVYRADAGSEMHTDDGVRTVCSIRLPSPEEAHELKDKV